jgi:hypothetical protein
MHEVRDGMWTVEFKGELIASHTTELRHSADQVLPPGVDWSDVSPDDAKSYLRWVEMELYRVEPDQEDELIRLPDGGYFYHVAHQTVCYHRHDAPHRFQGVPKLAGSTQIDLLPCKECDPPLLWDPQPEDPDDPQLLCDPQLSVDVEPVRHELFRAETPRAIVEKVHGRRVTVPAQHLLEKARNNDPQIRAVFARPRSVRAVP